ncbi:putative membrane protein [Microbacterium sp. W4I4]|uniref:DUF3159 domain-containing protein n=1 Tax=Microbacterium sp. W4I4 TaxID=3042295 RepID=UPI002786E04E|nr:DUF3159 domain-containing protein [Microbacterium sp. W4I4]MDQ0612756.1 putative membrane protein [Microbacterium sp. W4I4]
MTPTDDEQRDSAAKEPSPAEPSAAELIGAALGGAARRAGLDSASGESTQKVVWSAIGGWRGVLESVLPSLAFVILFTLRPEPLILSLGVSVGLAAVFTLVRLLQKSPPSAALGGLIAAGAAALLALWTGRGADNFVPGLITNAVYGTGMIVSALIGWSLIGLAVGFLMGEGTAWRTDRRRRRAFFWLGIAWGLLFLLRLAVQLPLYLTDQVTLLGTLKLVMGLPLFAPMIAVTWLVVRALYPRGE